MAHSAATKKPALVIVQPVTQPLLPEVPPTPAFPTLIQDAGKVYAYLNHSIGFEGYVPSIAHKYKEEKPWMRWKGGRISWEVWHQILAFFEWSQKEFKSEAQVRLFYNPATKQWKPWAFPQVPAGMTTKEIADHADTDIQRPREFPNPWIVLGTVHHHCTSSAFQSGTDSADEVGAGIEGVHITVGGISSEEYSIHGRMIVRGTQYSDIPWTQWFEPPAWMSALPAMERITLGNMLTRAKLGPTEAWLKQPPPDNVEFPADWKTNCHPPAARQVGFQQGFHHVHKHGMTPPEQDTTTLFDQFTLHELSFMAACRKIMEEVKLDHDSADALVDADLNSVDPTLPIPSFCKAVRTAATAWQVDLDDVDRLFDMWDFAVVLDELKRLNKFDATADLAQVAPATEAEAHQMMMQ